jgi:hypothetical protein
MKKAPLYMAGHIRMTNQDQHGSKIRHARFHGGGTAPRLVIGLNGLAAAHRTQRRFS